MKKIVLALFLGCLLSATGCFSGGSGQETASESGNESLLPAAALAQVSIRLRLHDESLRASLRAQTAPAAVFSLKLINRGNLNSPIILMRKRASITFDPLGSGTANVTFTSVPAVPVIATLDLEGASILGASGVKYSSFHGGADLLPGQNNEVIIVASGSAQPEDVLARAALLSMADYPTMTNISSALFTNLLEVFNSSSIVDQASPDKVFASYRTRLTNAAITQVTGGTIHSLAVRDDGTLVAWGNNAYGQLACPNISESYYPRFSPLTRKIKSCAAGEEFTLLLGDDNKVYACGINDSSQLGISGVTSTAYPLEVPGLSSITAIVAGNQHALAIDSNSQLYVWGDNTRGQLGLGNISTAGVVAQALTGMGNVKTVAAGNNFSMVVKNDGTVWVAGDNSFSQLATDAVELSTTFVPISLPTAAVSVAVGGGHCLVLGSNGVVYTWGKNFSGQTGLATTTAFIASPQPVSGLSSIKQLFAGQEHSLALTTTGSLYVFGDNSFGQLGRPLTTTKILLPDNNGFFSGVTVAGSGANNSYAVETGIIYVWGDNSGGQVGNGPPSVAEVSTPMATLVKSWL